MARIRTTPRWAVRVDPELFRDIEFAETLTMTARSIWLSSMLYLAKFEHPDGVYPHAELAREAGRGANSIATELTDFGLWRMVALGYLVQPYSGCRVTLEARAVIPDSVRQLVYQRDGYRCVFCDSPNNLSLDHIYPWSLGGTDAPSNLQTLCRPCNSSKGARI